MKFDKKDLKVGKIETNTRKGNSGLVRSGGTHKDRSKFDKSRERQSDRKLSRRIHEAQVVQNFRLNDNQKSILSNLVGPDGENVSIVDLTTKAEEKDRQNITQNIKLLQKLGLLNVATNGKLSVSDKGMGVMKDEKLTDETGGLSPDGNRYRTMFSRDQDQAQGQGGGGMAEPGLGGGGGMPMVGGDMGGMGGMGGDMTTELPVGNGPMAGGEGEPMPGEEGGEGEGMPGDDQQMPDQGQQPPSNNKQNPFGESFSLLRTMIDDENIKKQIAAINGL